jgi:hypothetical protein
VQCIRYQIDELAAVLCLNNIHICCITEKWLNADIPTEAVDIDGYVCHRRDRSDGRESVSHIIIPVIYHLPDAVNIITTTHIVDNVDALLRQQSHSGVILVGDSNRTPDAPLRDIRLKQTVKAATRKQATLVEKTRLFMSGIMTPLYFPELVNCSELAFLYSSTSS